VKLVVALLVVAAVALAMAAKRRRSDAASFTWFRAAGILAIANVVVAVVWH
jgi:hypothetical protein